MHQHLRPKALPKLSSALLLKLATAVLMVAAVIAASVVLLRGGVDLARHPMRLNVPLVLMSFAIGCSGLLVMIPVWRRVLAAFQCHASLRDHTRVYCYSMLGVILPGGIWPMVSRSILYQRLGMDNVMVAAASVVESLVIGIAAMAVYAVYVVVQPGAALWRRPEIGMAFAALAAVLLYPRVFNRLANWALARRRPGAAPLVVRFRAGEMLLWLVLEAVVVVSGGLALYVLLSSMIPVPLHVLGQLIGAWSAAVAVGNLFFWLPATSLLRDGVLVVALVGSISLPLAVLFVVLARVWSIASLLLVAGLVWLALDYGYGRLRRIHRGGPRRAAG